MLLIYQQIILKKGFYIRSISKIWTRKIHT